MKTEMAAVDSLLCRWGRWALRCESGALGFSSCSILATSGDGDAFDTATPHGVLDEDIQSVDEAIRRLPKVLRMVVVEVYQFSQGKSDRKIAAILGIHVETMRKYVCEAQRKIALDISVSCAQNPAQSANGGSVPRSRNT